MRNTQQIKSNPQIKLLKNIHLSCRFNNNFESDTAKNNNAQAPKPIKTTYC